MKFWLQGHEKIIFPLRNEVSTSNVFHIDHKPWLTRSNVQIKQKLKLWYTNIEAMQQLHYYHYLIYIQDQTSSCIGSVTADEHSARYIKC